MKQTDGIWDSEERHLYFISVFENSLATAGRVNKSLLIAAPYLARDKDISKCRDFCDSGGRLLIDSGVFGIAAEAARTMGVPLAQAIKSKLEDIEGSADFLQKWRKVIDATRDVCWGYIEIDLGGTQGKRETRAMLEELGYRPIPVFHCLTDPWEYFEELATQYDRVAVGNLVDAGKETRERILRRIHEARRSLPVKWVHALGVGVCPSFLSAPSESCDASSPTAPLRFCLPMKHTSAFEFSAVPEFGYRHGQGKHAYQTMVAWLYRDAAHAQDMMNAHLRGVTA